MAPRIEAKSRSNQPLLLGFTQRAIYRSCLELSSC